MGALILSEQAAAGTPASGDVVVYPKSDGLLYWKDDVGTERVIVPTAAQTFLGADVLLNNTSNYFNVVDTGSIGASGQAWLLIASVALTDTAGAANINVRVWDSTTVFEEASMDIRTANAVETCTIPVIVTPSAAATYSISCKDTSSTSGKALTTGNAGTANKATSIVAVRLY